MSKNMVERVARAIAEPIMRKFCGWHPKEPVVWERLPERDRGDLCTIARAAIEAMREPTEAMVQAGSEAAELQWCDLEIGYPPMIDAALKP